MSTRFTIVCHDHDAVGPHIRRQHESAYLVDEGSARFFPVVDDVKATEDWGAFLLEHEYCDLELIREFRLLKAEPKPPNLPTHELLGDGSLREIQ